MAGVKAKGTKKGRKIGRNAKKCERYRRQGKREASHVRRITRHLRHHPNDEAAKMALKRWEDAATR